MVDKREYQKVQMKPTCISLITYCSGHNKPPFKSKKGDLKGKEFWPFFKVFGLSRGPIQKSQNNERLWCKFIYISETCVFCISVHKDLRRFHHFFHRKAPGHFDESSTRFWPLRLPTVMHHFAPNEKNVGKPLSKANLYL